MSKFWMKIIKIVPPFGGSASDAAANIDSHLWRVARFTELYSEADANWGGIVACRACGVAADTEASKYPCGTAPDPVSLRDWKQRRHK